MVLFLHAPEPPRGRCLLLAHALYDVTGRMESIDLAIALFEFNHDAVNPPRVSVVNSDAVEALRTVCAEFGILVEVQDP